MKKVALSLFVTVVSIAAFLACSGPQQPPTTKTTTDLRTTVQDFHVKMRWGMWEQAAAYVAPSYRPSFEARYDELGEDFKISNLEIRSVANSSPTTALIDVEQESYKEPEMTVKKVRYIETWELGSNVWRLTERIEKDEWEERLKAEKEAAEARIEAADSAEETGDDPDPAVDQDANGREDDSDTGQPDDTTDSQTAP